MKHIKHVKYIIPADRYISQLPDYSKFGRKSTLIMNPDHILDLHWKLANTYHTTSIGYTTSLTMQPYLSLWKLLVTPKEIYRENGTEQF